MDHYRLSDELRQQLLENAAWGKAGVTPRLDEMDYGGNGGNGGDHGEDHGDDDKPEGKAKKKKPAPKEKKKEKPEMAEEEVAHVCPLCTSHLDEAIDEERILEHLNVVVGLVERLTQLQEGEEDVDTVIDETLAELLFQDLEEE